MDIKEWLPELLPQEMWKDKYRFEDETFDEWLDRVSGGNKRIRNMIERKEFLFGGRILANRGLQNKGRKVTYSNCYVSTPPEDNIESIYEACAKLARTFSYGGGVGIDISRLRPSGAKVNNAAKTTSGAVSFMETFNHVSEVIAQNGRRGALMISMDVNHPDIEDFIDIKTNTNKITKANISIRVTDDFMKCVEEDREFECKFEVGANGEVITKTINARKLFKKLCQNNWNWAEPGILYWDRIKDYNLMQHDDSFSYAGVNPCAEEPLPAGGSCLLGSLNLSEFVRTTFNTTTRTNTRYFSFGEFKDAVRDAVIALNDVLEEGLELHPLEEQRKAVEELRQIGLGVMGIAECLMKLGIRYGSEESLKVLDEIAHTMSFTALDTSNDLAIERGMFDKCNPKAIVESDFFKNAISHLSESEKHEFISSVWEYGLRNSQLLTVAPTGSLSTMLNISGGIEPMFAFTFTRKTESLKGKDEYFTITSPLVDEIRKEIKDGIMSEDILVNAHMLKPIERVRVQAVWQKYTDAAISSTVNMHKDATLEDVYDTYMEAWKQGLKGITVYRDGCKRGGVLTTNETEESKDAEDTKIHIELSDTNVEHCAGYGAQLTTGCGTLWVTFYFHRKSGQLCHVFLDKGSTGGCNSFMVGLSRMISLAGKKGATVDEIVDQLTSTIACNSFSGRKANKKDTSKGSSCPAAIGHSLNRLYKRFLEEKSEGLIKSYEDDVDNEDKIINKCPDCGRELQMSGGCVQCVCGYSQCG